MDFLGKTALITGAGRGIGAACAMLFAKNGAQVVINDLESSKLIEITDRMRMMKAECLAFPCNVADESSVKTMVEKAEERYGKIDILINNAGIFRVNYQPFLTQKSDHWKLKIDVNILGTMYCTHAVLPGMVKRRYGKIVNLSSVAGVYGLRNMIDYSMTKGAIISFTKALAKEMGQYGININAVSPGNISTYQELPELSFLERSGSAEECANVIAFLASDRASFVSGQNYIVDGCRKTM